MGLTKETKWLKPMVVCSGLYVYTFVFAMPYGFGSFLNAIQDKFQQSLSVTVAVQAIFVGVTLSTSILSGMLISRFGIVKTSLVGAFLLSFGFIVSFLAESIVHLYICISIISGVGVSIVFLGSVTCVSSTFTGSKRLLILAIQSAGISVGVAVLPYVWDYLLMLYGLNGTFLLIGGFYLNCVPMARIYAIIERNQADTLETEKENQAKTTGPGLDKEKVSSLKSAMRVVKDELLTLLTHVKVVILDGPFTLTIISFSVSFGSLNSYFALIVDILKWKGFTSSQALLAFPITYGVGFVARLLPGIVKQFKKVNSFILPIVYCACGLSSQLVIYHSSSTYVILLGCSLSGIAISGNSSCINIVVVQLLEKEYIAIGLGLVYTGIGIATTISGPVYGAVKDKTSSYALILYLVAGFQLVSAFLILMTIILRKKQNRSREYGLHVVDNYAPNKEDNYVQNEVDSYVQNEIDNDVQKEMDNDVQNEMDNDVQNEVDNYAFSHSEEKN